MCTRSPCAVRQFGDGRHLGGTVDGADLGGLRQRHHARLGEVDVAAPRDRLEHGLGRELAALAADGQQLGAVGEEFRPAAFVRLDVRQLVADHAVVALAQRGQRQRVGDGAVEDEIDVAIGLEQRAQAVGDAPRPVVLAVAGGIAGIGGEQGLQGFGADARAVVAGELLHGASVKECRGRRKHTANPRLLVKCCETTESAAP
jgi:hypothetical protein